MEIEVVTRETDLLGECPVWLGDELMRVDISRGLLHVGGSAPVEVEPPLGFALPRAGGGAVVGCGRELRLLPEGSVIAAVEPELPENRFNDAACDARGRLWAGTMSTTRQPGAAALYRVSPGGAVVPVLRATLSNGLDWDREATRMYYVDSTTQRVDVIGFDLDSGTLGARRAFAEIEPVDGLPDGLTVDAEGGVWIALFGGGAIRRYAPEGRLESEVRLPVSCPTSLAFGGPGLADLYVTSSRHRLSAEQLEREPLAGSLLRLRPGVRGRPANRFGG